MTITTKCPCCGFNYEYTKDGVEHVPNTLCPYGLVSAIKAGFITEEEASRRLSNIHTVFVEE